MDRLNEKIKQHIPQDELLAQLAEECAELSQAALKLRRALTGINPTPVTAEEARKNLVEETADVYNVLGLLLDAVENAEIYDIIRRKKARNGWRGDSLAIVRENEEKKRYLNGYRDCTRRERQLQEQIDELRSQQMFPSVNHDGMPQGNAHSDLSGYVARLDALVSQLEAEKEIAIREYNEIYNQVQLMHSSANWSMSRLWRYGNIRKSMTGYIRCRTGRRRKC